MITRLFSGFIVTIGWFCFDVNHSQAVSMETVWQRIIRGDDQDIERGRYVSAALDQFYREISEKGSAPRFMPFVDREGVRQLCPTQDQEQCGENTHDNYEVGEGHVRPRACDPRGFEKFIENFQYLREAQQRLSREFRELGE